MLELTKDQKLDIFYDVLGTYVIDGMIETLKIIDIDKFDDEDILINELKTRAICDVDECIDEMELGLEGILDLTEESVEKDNIRYEVLTKIQRLRDRLSL